MKVKVLTHTGSDLPLDEAKAIGVPVIPDIVILGQTEYKNMFDITAEEFYEKLVVSETIPTSSHPSIGDFKSFFMEAGADADEILFLSVTSKMSGTYMTAISAKDALVKEGFTTPIYVYDTMQCSHAMAQMTREAARLSDLGYTATEIMNFLDDYKNKMGMYFLLDTLKYAQKGGRVGAIKALAADALKIKPLLVFTEGVVKDIGVTRGFEDGLLKVADKYEKEADFNEPLTIFSLGKTERAKQLAELIIGKHPDVKIRYEVVGPVIGIYAGPGGAGLAFVKK